MRMKSIIYLPFFIISTCQIALGQMKWYNPMNSSNYPIHGRAWNEEIGKNFNRLPERHKKNVRQAVWYLSQQSAGMYIKFYTNSNKIHIKYDVSGPHALPHMPATGVSGIDLYSTNADGNQYWCSGIYQFGDSILFQYNDLTYNNTDSIGNEFTLFLPLYNNVKTLQIGVEANSQFHFLFPSIERPIVIYGTSIAQGACASRPGMAWGNILQRKLDTPIVNLGFSGNGLLEKNLFHILSEIDASLFIIDCMPNMTAENTSLIQERLEQGIQILRKKSEAPILLVEHDGLMGDQMSLTKEKSFRKANEVLQKTYYKIKNIYKNIYYLSYEELNLDQDSQVDGCHATDKGMQEYADAYYKKIIQILYKGMDRLSFQPRRQHREICNYNWHQRHCDILKHNLQHQSDIIMIGNSITHYWGGEPIAKPQTANDIWEKLFSKKNVANLGFGWDKIENVLWRIYHGELDGYSAKKIFLMIGTNNLHSNSNEEIVTGIIDVINAISYKQPNAQLYVIQILPREGYEERISQLNRSLEEKLRTNENIKMIDLSKHLTNKQGKIESQLFRDGLHPNRKGYSVIYKRLKQFVDE